MVNFGLLSAEILSLVWGTPANFNGFRVAPPIFDKAAITVGIGPHSSCWMIEYSGRGVQQRVPPIFGRAAITLGIGPHL